MEVVINRKNNCTFKELSDGDTFLYDAFSSNNVYIKKREYLTDSLGIINAVCLNDGDLCCFSGATNVKRCNVKIEATVE